MPKCLKAHAHIGVRAPVVIEIQLDGRGNGYEETVNSGVGGGGDDDGLWRTVVAEQETI